ncbi:hypothetical protein [uncultured Polaribacter sp.]|uniref:IS256 family transposase, variant Zn-binding type n=1 Tax=uncultured Polaribacter sp. TaxID=174711 RepID=UPI0030D8840F|tara:strand:- start:1977 stop:2819 length:843 start_codon:yes stop_codon:yes gene_type:complete
MYKCYICKKQFSEGSRLNSAIIWEEYTRGKQTYKQLAKKYNCSQRTIQRKVDLHVITVPEKRPRKVVVLMDTTYWGRNFGVMLFKDAYTKENLLKYYVKTETNSLYIQGVKELQSKGFEVLAIVCDGRKGLLQSFDNIPVQMCQFHQVAIIRRYITKNPKIPASIELKEFDALLKMTDKESFESGLELWFNKWESFLNERTINLETGKSYFTHKRLRSAYRSLKTNSKWLFTWYDNYGLKIPNTTNAIDGHFSDLKNKLRNHNGLSKERKIKFIDEFFKA